VDSASMGAGLEVSRKKIASGHSGHLSEGSEKAPLTVNKLRISLLNVRTKLHLARRHAGRKPHNSWR
jgi:hypothetical protein